MAEFQLITDSTTDLSRELVAEMDVHVIPMLFTVEDKSYWNTVDEKDMSAHAFYELLRGGKTATTSQVNSEYFKEQARPFLDAGQDVLYLAFSSGLSGTYNAACIGAEDLREEYPDRKIVVVDTLAASMGEGLLVYHAAKLRKGGKALEEVAKWVEDNRLNLAHWFTVDDLHFLKRGGRVSSTAAVVGSMLSIKPILHVDDEGHLIPMEKVRGRRQSLKALVDHMEKTAIEPENQVVFISHGDVPEDCKLVESMIRERCGVKTVYTNNIGPVVGSHSGPGTMALFFLANHR